MNYVQIVRKIRELGITANQCMLWLAILAIRAERISEIDGTENFVSDVFHDAFAEVYPDEREYKNKLRSFFRWVLVARIVVFTWPLLLEINNKSEFVAYLNRVGYTSLNPEVASKFSTDKKFFKNVPGMIDSIRMGMVNALITYGCCSMSTYMEIYKTSIPADETAKVEEKTKRKAEKKAERKAGKKAEKKPETKAETNMLNGVSMNDADASAQTIVAFINGLTEKEGLATRHYYIIRQATEVSFKEFLETKKEKLEKIEKSA